MVGEDIAEMSHKPFVCHTYEENKKGLSSDFPNKPI